MDWTAWKDFVIEEWTTLFPEELSMVFRWMAEDMEKMYKVTKTLQVLTVRVKEEETQKQEDIKMEGMDVPKTLYPTPMPSQSPLPPAYKSTDAPITNKKTLATWDQREMEDLKDQVKELERCLKDGAKETRRRLMKIEEDVLEDTLNLADLKWRTADLEEENNKTKATENKAYKKAKRTQHKYETRYAATQGESQSS